MYITEKQLYSMFIYTIVKLALCDFPMECRNTVTLNRWSLNTGLIKI